MSNSSGARWIGALVLGAALATGTAAAAATRCDQLLVRLAHQITDANCFESTDLTTNNPTATAFRNFKHSGDQVFGPVIDCVLGAESDNRPDLGVRASDPDHFHAVDQRKLDRRAADSTRCSMDKDAFCQGSACRRVEEVIGDLI